VTRPLGKPGGFGGVYAGEADDGSPMAVKVVSKQRPQGALDERLLRREGDIGKRVAESGSEMLLPVIDSADAGDALLLIMPELRARWQISPFHWPKPRRCRCWLTSPRACKTCTRSGSCTGTLSRPTSCAHAERWKLADFGLARDQEIGTQDPTFVGWGSFPYMAPELWELKSPTVKTDLYAFGCLAFELLAGTVPFPGTDQAAIRSGHLTQVPWRHPAVTSSSGT
jgi:eukaryotic-like serine/threonine-protein kinase